MSDDFMNPPRRYTVGELRNYKIDAPSFGGGTWSSIKPETPFPHHPTEVVAWAELEGNYRHPLGLVRIHAQTRYRSTEEGWEVHFGHVSYSTQVNGREYWRFDRFKHARPSERKLVHQARLFLRDVLRKAR